MTNYKIFCTECSGDITKVYHNIHSDHIQQVCPNCGKLLPFNIISSRYGINDEVLWTDPCPYDYLTEEEYNQACSEPRMVTDIYLNDGDIIYELDGATEAYEWELKLFNKNN